MKKIKFLLVFFYIYSNGQIAKDTIVTVKSSWYGRTMFCALTTGDDTKGETLSQRITRNIEIGKSFGSVDIGVALGEYKHMVADSARVTYSALRLSLDACQFGIFSNEISIGAGYIFNSKTPVMMEISSTLYAQISDKFGLGFVYGNVDFVGNYTDMNKSFFGLYLRYGLIRDEGGILNRKLHVISHTKNHLVRKRTKLL